MNRFNTAVINNVVHKIILINGPVGNWLEYREMNVPKEAPNNAKQTVHIINLFLLLVNCLAEVTGKINNADIKTTPTA